MLRNINDLKNRTIQAKDGEIGKVKGFYFDDIQWTIRYLVADTGGFLTSKDVLISPTAFIAPDWKMKNFPVNITKEQVKNSPEVDFPNPLSQEEEKSITGHYGWPEYWTAESYQPKGTTQVSVKTKHFLLSTKDLYDYDIIVDSDVVGSIEDLIIDENNWKINYLILNRSGFKGSKAILPDHIQKIDIDNKSVTLDLPKEKIEKGPDYSSETNLDESFHNRVKDFYSKY